MTKVSASDLCVFTSFVNHSGECLDAEIPQLCQQSVHVSLGDQTEFHVQPLSHHSHPGKEATLKSR